MSNLVSTLSFSSVVISSICNAVIINNSQKPFFKSYHYHGHFDRFLDIHRGLILFSMIAFAGSFTNNGFFAIMAAASLFIAICLVVAAFNISRK